MERSVIQTETAPAAIGPYSQAISIGNMVFCSGQLGLDPATGQIASEDVAGQTRQILLNLQAVLGAAGLGLHHIVKTTVFLADMADFRTMNEVYAEFFTSAPPARSTVAVRDLPLAARVEIEAIAARS